MAKFCTLASGSSGNSTYISTTDGDILVDIGISYKALNTSLAECGCNIEKLRAVAITHTHTDHIKGLKTFLKRHKIPIICSLETSNFLAENNLLPSAECEILLTDNKPITLGDISVDFFKTSHDADGSMGYVITLPDGKKSAVCTDLGVITPTVKEHLAGCDTVLIESNHDVEMLRRGPYPAQLKLRILSETGHLSNNDCAAVLPYLLQNGTKRIVLGHLSDENNTPLLALSTSRTALLNMGAKQDWDYILTVAKPKTVGVTLF